MIKKEEDKDQTIIKEKKLNESVLEEKGKNLLCNFLPQIMLLHLDGEHHHSDRGKEVNSVEQVERWDDHQMQGSKDQHTSKSSKKKSKSDPKQQQWVKVNRTRKQLRDQFDQNLKQWLSEYNNTVRFYPQYQLIFKELYVRSRFGQKPIGTVVAVMDKIFANLNSLQHEIYETDKMSQILDTFVEQYKRFNTIHHKQICVLRKVVGNVKIQEESLREEKKDVIPVKFEVNPKQKSWQWEQEEEIFQLILNEKQRNFLNRLMPWGISIQAIHSHPEQEILKESSNFDELNISESEMNDDKNSSNLIQIKSICEKVSEIENQNVTKVRMTRIELKIEFRNNLKAWLLKHNYFKMLSDQYRIISKELRHKILTSPSLIVVQIMIERIITQTKKNQLERSAIKQITSMAALFYEEIRMFNKLRRLHISVYRKVRKSQENGEEQIRDKQKMTKQEQLFKKKTAKRQILICEQSQPQSKMQQNPPLNSHVARIKTNQQSNQFMIKQLVSNLMEYQSKLLMIHSQKIGDLTQFLTQTQGIKTIHPQHQ